MINSQSVLLFIIILISGITRCFCQNINNRAIKLTEKAEEVIKERQFDEARQLLTKAIAIDPTYSKPYFRLSTIYNLYQQLDSATRYYNLALSQLNPSQVSQQMWERAAGLNYACGNYQEAFEAIRRVDTPDGRLLRHIEFSVKSINQEVQVQQIALPDEINGHKLQYFPCLTVDESTIIFTKRNTDAPYADEDLMISTKINGQWIPAQSISKEINTRFNEGASTISADGRTLIFTSCDGRASFGSCDLYLSFRQGNTWSRPENLGAPVNTRFWESQPSLSADGRTLYFSSNRTGGRGKRDIWVTKLTSQGWSDPKNLGPTINTQFDETTPFIHVNGEVLFFSSKGHPGLGGFDLFSTQRNDTSWAAPKNLGYPINTLHDEFSMFINAQGTQAYFAKEKTENNKIVESKIVRFAIPNDSLVAHKSSYITGRVLDKDSGKSLNATLQMTNLNDSTDRYFVEADSVTGRYFLVLTQGNQYGVFVKKPQYLFEDLHFMAEESSALQPDTIDVYLKPIASGESIILENIYFDSDSYELSRKSRSELDELVIFILENPEYTFMIEGHTDNVGSLEYNLDLSNKRAHNVYLYLSKHGAPVDRLRFKGFGSTNPIADNTLEAGRKRNRRITISLL